MGEAMSVPSGIAIDHGHTRRPSLPNVASKGPGATDCCRSATSATSHPTRMPESGPTRLRPHRRRPIRHLVIAAAAAMAGWAVVLLRDSDNVTFLLSMATAYASLLLLGATLVIGPWNVIRGRPNPVSTYLRRDLGIWAGLLAL